MTLFQSAAERTVRGCCAGGSTCSSSTPDDLARLIVTEEGKPLAEARGEVAYAASFVEWFAEDAKRIGGEIFPALVAGCTMVVKPAEQTPLTRARPGRTGGSGRDSPRVCSTWWSATPAKIGAELTANPLVRKLTFTGSTEDGRLLIAQSARTVKKVSMELGGNAPVLVFDDADLDVAVAGVLAAKYRNTGQSTFAEELAARARTLSTGDGFTPDVAVGPLIDAAAVAKAESHVTDATTRGARVLCGGGHDARFFEPTVLADVPPDALVAREETFAPITPLIRLANDTEFGLAAYLFTRDAERTWRVAAALETGTVGINTGLISNEVAPFGGSKQSGLGREGSVHGIDEYLELKYLAWEGAGTDRGRGEHG